MVLVYLYLKLRVATKTDPPEGVIEPYYSEIQGTVPHAASDVRTSEGGVVMTTLGSMDDPISLKDCEAYIERKVLQAPPLPEQAPPLSKDDYYI